MTPAHPFLSSNDALSLRDLVLQIGHSWLQGAASCTETDVLFGTMKTVLSGALLTLATQWNDGHDHLRTLPLELRDMCMLCLPAADKYLLGSVCSFWRDAIFASPSIWTDIALPDGLGTFDLADLIRRSGQLPFRVALSVSSKGELEGTSSLIHPHAHRLRALEIEIIMKSEFRAPVSAFEYPVPMLRLLNLKGKTFHIVPPDYEISSNLFAGAAPQLRSVVLEKIQLPATCPAFSAVLYATLRDLGGPGMSKVLPIFPSLRRLDPLSISSPPLPPIPADHCIEELALLSAPPMLTELEELGYMRIPRLKVISDCGADVLVEAADALASSSDVTLTVDTSRETELVLRRDGGRSATFVSTRLHEICDALSTDAFRDLAHLVLPLHVISANVGDEVGCPILRGRVDLPKLHSLTLRCGPPNRFTLSLIDPNVPRGVIVAPGLARLDVLPESPFAFDAPALRLEHLADFIERHLVLENAVAALELFIDTAHGVYLENHTDLEIARLTACVGALHI